LASATTHLAQATASFGPNARAAPRRGKIAELRHRDASQRERRPLPRTLPEDDQFSHRPSDIRSWRSLAAARLSAD